MEAVGKFELPSRCFATRKTLQFQREYRWEINLIGNKAK